MKKNVFVLILGAALLALSTSGLAQDRDLEEVVEQVGSLGSKVVTLLYFIIGAAGVWLAWTGFRRILSKDNDEQTQKGGPLRIVIGLIFVIFPIFMNMSTEYFTGAKTEKEEIIQDPFN